MHSQSLRSHRDNAPQRLLGVHRRHELVVDEQSSRKLNRSSGSGDFNFRNLSHSSGTSACTVRGRDGA